MAKTVAPVAVELKIKGGEKMAALNKSFRDLSKQVKLSDQDIKNAVKGIVEFAEKSGNSEATIKAQIKAFEGLREQAEQGGKSFVSLGKKISALQDSLFGLSQKSQDQAKRFMEIGRSSEASASQIQRAIAGLQALSKEAVKDSEAFVKLQKDTLELVDALESLEQKTEKQKQVTRLLNGVLRKSTTLISLQSKVYKERARQTEEQIRAIELLTSAEQKQAKNVKERKRLEEQLQKQLLKITETGYLEFVASSRRETIQLAQAFNSTDNSIRSFNQRLKKLDQDFGKLPQTAAGVRQRIAELQTQLDNTEPGKEYVNLTIEISNKQKELQKILTGTADAYDKLSAAQDRSARVAEKLAGIQQYQAETGRVAPGAGGYRDPVTGAIIARGAGSIADRRAFRRARAELANAILESAVDQARTLALPAAGQTSAVGTGAAVSGGARRIGIGRDVVRGVPTVDVTAPAVGLGEQVIRKQASALREAASALVPYNDAIRKARIANNNSVTGIDNLKNALIAKRNEIPATSAAFRRLTKEIQVLDAKSERLSRRIGRRRMSAGQFAQAAGATLSGGIFGGPEGFLGGAIGTALGGPGGAFAGAAVGAQLGQIRQQVGQFTEYSAEIAKLKIALRGAAGSQDEFNRAVEAARSATAELNVPQETAIRGMTRLTAAVKGAGGQVSDAELVFRNVSSAIKATGGNAQDVDSALTAMVQVFSKGKVSAEELSGQLGERLPGAVTKFAKANKLTLPELQKALKAGTVGLNELMRFIEDLGREYDGTSKKIASSSEEAGARLQIAYNQMRISVGSALEPIGAEFQNAFAQFIYEYTPELTAAAQAIGNAMLALSRVLKPILAGLASFAAVFAAGKLAAFIKGVAGSLGLFGVTTKAAAGSVAALTAAMLTNPLFLGAAAVGGIVAGIVLITDALGKQRRELKALNDEMAKRAPSLSANERNIAITANRRELALIERDLEKIEDPKPGSEQARLARRNPDAVNRKIVDLKNRRLELLKAQRALTKSTVLKTSDTDFGSPKPDESASKSGKKRESRVPQLAQELSYLASAAQIKERIRAAELDGNRMLQIRLQGEMRLLQLAKQSALVDLEKIPAEERQLKQAILLQKAEQARLDIAQKLAMEGKRALENIEAPLKNLVREYEKEVRTRKRLNELIKQGVDKGLAEEFVKIEEIIQAQRELLDQRIVNTEAALLVKDIEEETRKELERQLEILKKQKEELPEEEGKAKGAAGDAQEPEKDFFGKLDDAIEAQRDALEDLVEPINQIVSAADAIGDAFKNSFKSVIDGSSSAKQALSNFFKSVGDYFLDMAAEIAAEALKLAALQFVKFIVGSFAEGGYVSGGFNAQGTSGAAFAEGGYVSGGFKAFSSGGMVSQPTVGLVGEGSESEYIIPESKMRESMNRYSRGVRGPGVIPENGSATTMEGEGNIAVAAPIDVRYTVERINQVDYVTADEFRRGMKQAAQQGASEGQQRTLYALRQNTAQRRRIGI